MVQKFTVFNTLTRDEELDNEFHNFFYKNNLTALFTNEHRSSPIRVTDSDARAVVNSHGAYYDILKIFSDILSTATHNKKYEEAVFKIIYTASTFQKMMNIIKKIILEFKTTLEKHLYNFWNIVFYNKGLFN